MQYKHKLILSLAQELQKSFDETLQTLILQYKQQKEINYEFIELNGSPYSFELENDIKVLSTKDYLSKKRYAIELEFEDKMAVQKLKNSLANNSNPLTSNENNAPPSQPSDNGIRVPTEPILYTIGYEGLSIDAYINKLKQNNISCLVDVRQNAFSNKLGFSKNEFKYYLQRSGIEYIHIPQLGIESQKRQASQVGAHSVNKKPTTNKNHLPTLFNFIDPAITKEQEALNNLFEEYKQNLPSKRKYIDQLLSILNQYKTVAITCFEADYKCCHRSVLSNFLTGVSVKHL